MRSKSITPVKCPCVITERLSKSPLFTTAPANTPNKLLFRLILNCTFPGLLGFSAILTITKAQLPKVLSGILQKVGQTEKRASFLISLKIIDTFSLGEAYLEENMACRVHCGMSAERLFLSKPIGGVKVEMSVVEMWHLLEWKKSKDNIADSVFFFFYIFLLKLVDSYWYGDGLKLEAKEIKHDKD